MHYFCSPYQGETESAVCYTVTSWWLNLSMTGLSDLFLFNSVSGFDLFLEAELLAFKNRLKHTPNILDKRNYSQDLVLLLYRTSSLSDSLQWEVAHSQTPPSWNEINKASSNYEAWKLRWQFKVSQIESQIIQNFRIFGSFFTWWLKRSPSHGQMMEHTFNFSFSLSFKNEMLKFHSYYSRVSFIMTFFYNGTLSQIFS